MPILKNNTQNNFVMVSKAIISQEKDETSDATQTIKDFYLIDCQTFEVTDEQINTWH